jgi:hypothetical protein
MFGVMLVAIFGLLLSFLAFCTEYYYYRKKEHLLFRLRMRRALAEQAHLTAAAQVIKLIFFKNQWDYPSISCLL